MEFVNFALNVIICLDLSCLDNCVAGNGSMNNVYPAIIRHNNKVLGEILICLDHYSYNNNTLSVRNRHGETCLRPLYRQIVAQIWGIFG